MFIVYDINIIYCVEKKKNIYINLTSMTEVRITMERHHLYLNNITTISILLYINYISIYYNNIVL